MSAFNARAIASLAEVASSAMTRRLPNILNTMMDNVIASKDEELKSELETAFDTVLLSVDEFDGLNTAMSVMLALSKHDDERRRARADMHLAKFFADADVDFSRYYPDLIRALLISFGDSDTEVVKAAWTALSGLTKHMRKEGMEVLAISTRQILRHQRYPAYLLAGSHEWFSRSASPRCPGHFRCYRSHQRKVTAAIRHSDYRTSHSCGYRAFCRSQGSYPAHTQQLA